MQRHDPARLQPARAGPDFRAGHAAHFRPLPDDVIGGPGAPAELRLVPLQAADHVLARRITNDVTTLKDLLKNDTSWFLMKRNNLVFIRWPKSKFLLSRPLN